MTDATLRKPRSPLREFLSRQFYYLFWSGMMMALFISAMRVGPTIEGLVAPVITNYTPLDVQVTPQGDLVFRARYVKRRLCEFAGISWFSKDRDGTIRRAQILPYNPDSPLVVTRPVGEEETGLMIVRLEDKTAEVHSGILTYDCGGLWKTTVSVGPFPNWALKARG